LSYSVCTAAACRSIITSDAFADAAIKVACAVLELGPGSHKDHNFGNGLEWLAQMIGDGMFQEMSDSLIFFQNLWQMCDSCQNQASTFLLIVPNLFFQAPDDELTDEILHFLIK
jgi:hypothetical protein